MGAKQRKKVSPGAPSASRCVASRSVAAAAVLVASATSCDRFAYWSSADEETSPADPSGPSALAAAAVSAGTGEVVPADAGAVLTSVATCGVELYERFGIEAAALASDTARAASSGTEADRDAARGAWITAMSTWQEAELLRVGPAGPAVLPEGRNLRDEIYAWPLSSRCLVESTLVSRAYEEGDFAERALINVRTLAAAEYLLFYEPSDNACSATSSINATGAWADLSQAELASRKLRYAAVVTAGVEVHARELALAWSESGGGFGARLAAAGKSGSPFDSTQAALNAISDGLFYLDKEVKDAKLATPLGLLGCDASSCPEAVESRFAKRSVRHVEANLRGFRRFFAGCDASSEVGFDDLLAAAGAADVGLAMQVHGEQAIAAAREIDDDDLAAVIAADRPSAEALHAAVKRITDDLKTDMMSVLDLDAPASVEGDND